MSTGNPIRGATVVTPNLAAARESYARYFEYKVVEEGAVAPDLAAAWDAPDTSGRPYVVMGPPSGNPVFIRLIGGDPVPEYRPLRSYGWAALEITLADAHAMRERLRESPFQVIGEPYDPDWSPHIRPMQAIGVAGDVFYLNQVKSSPPNYELPLAQCFCDRIFIMVLAVADLDRSKRFYMERLGFAEGRTLEVAYRTINNAFGLPPATKQWLATIYDGRHVFLELDRYPEAAVPRPRAAGQLPPGAAITTLAVPSLDRVDATMIAPPRRREGPFYGGGRVATCRGPDGELIELVEAPS